MKYIIEGRGYIEQNGHREYFKNHFVGNGLEALANTAENGAYIIGTSLTYNYYFSQPWFLNNLDIGTNQSTPTTFNTSGNTSSVQPFYSLSFSISTATNGSQVISIVIVNYQVSSFPAITIGEMSLYTSNFGYISRTSVADGDFSPFSYNPANALAVVWQIVLGFQ